MATPTASSRREVGPLPRAHWRAIERGRASVITGDRNPYAYGTQCWMLFEKERGLAARKVSGGSKR